MVVSKMDDINTVLGKSGKCIEGRGKLQENVGRGGGGGGAVLVEGGRGGGGGGGGGGWWGGGGGGGVVELLPMFGAFTNDVISEYAYGFNLGWTRAPGFNKVFFEMVSWSVWGTLLRGARG